MAGIITQLLLSWVIIWMIERKNLSVLGLKPTPTRLGSFTLVFIMSCLICASGFLMKDHFSDIDYSINPALTGKLAVTAIWWNIKSVLFEELIFRGVLLYILIKKIGDVKAIIVSAIAFGIYHWFSFNIIGNIFAMITTFFITGLMGLLLAYGYSKTYSLYVPIGIHLGWNLTQIFIFSDGPVGDGLFINKSNEGFRTSSYIVFITVSFLPLVMALLVNFLLIRKHKSLPI